MSTEQARHAIMQHTIAHVTSADRAARLLDRIKVETRWQLIATPARSFRIDESDYAGDRAKLIAVWPAIRHRRLDVAASFYDVVGDKASLLAHLIEIRRQRAHDRRGQ